VIGFDTDAAVAKGDARLGAEIATGGNGVELLARARCVVKSPGVPREAPVVAAALERGIPVIGELELAWRMLPQEFVAVTGTNGKTTTVELIAAIYRAAGLPVEVAGNVGRALSELVLEPLAAGTTIVCEASSFQLEDTRAFSPEAAVLLNLTEDHLDRHLTFDSYKEAKLRIFANQREGSVAVLPEGLVASGPGCNAGGGPGRLEEIPGLGERVLFGVSDHSALRYTDGILHWHGRELMHAEALGARGPVENSMAAAAVTLARGVPIDAVREALAGFKGVAHRLEQIATIDGVLYVNDSKATNVASTLVALDAFAAGSVLLILGGQGKLQDFGPLREAIAARAAHTYLIGEDAERIEAAIAGLPNTHAGTLERAVELARAAARPEMVVLLSPACASFDQFADFEARGDAFRGLVNRQA
jgi:UDP-N-acetylmuramoylalanine--D-glutamate ligase